MKSKILSVYTLILVLIVGQAVTALIPANAADSKSSKINSQGNIQTVGIINPDGAKSVWMISNSSDGDIPGLLAKYPSKMIDGLKFYSLSSWQDTARFLTIVHEQQARVMRQLVQNMQKLNKKIGNIEKKRQRVVHSGSMDSRVQALEKKVDYMSDGGYR